MAPHRLRFSRRIRRRRERILVLVGFGLGLALAGNTDALVRVIMLLVAG